MDDPSTGAMTVERARRGVGPGGGATGEAGPPLTRREREILGLLAGGLSGAQIADALVLSPETVRTHVRNAMAKLGASTRPQAVVLAMQRREIAPEDAPDPRVSPVMPAAGDVEALSAMLDGLVSLYDLEGGAVYLADEDGLSLRRATGATAAGDGGGLPSSLALGNGPLGKVALERRAQLVHSGRRGGGTHGVVAAPMLGGGRLLGLIALESRLSRPIGRSELLLLQAFANRVAEVLVAGSDVDRRLARAMERFRSSWASSGRG
jgi:DNA-binding CsgD family transcriptional regulator